ncbi:hypothetical protein cyc_02350 [Cyclospora cayetanensis]|uniref:Uncharacterized protein n=1 Tax=Cyclospora cayetanensis TaxID=88456 RepID=A0A1D3D0X9_9EIME|nr:hypothetical protein cyc_02350 [Cyclospora cayetanensis]
MRIVHCSRHPWQSKQRQQLVLVLQKPKSNCAELVAAGTLLLLLQVHSNEVKQLERSFNLCAAAQALETLEDSVICVLHSASVLTLYQLVQQEYPQQSLQLVLLQHIDVGHASFAVDNMTSHASASQAAVGCWGGAHRLVALSYASTLIASRSSSTASACAAEDLEELRRICLQHQQKQQHVLHAPCCSSCCACLCALAEAASRNTFQITGSAPPLLSLPSHPEARRLLAETILPPLLAAAASACTGNKRCSAVVFALTTRQILLQRLPASVLPDSLLLRLLSFYESQLETSTAAAFGSDPHISPPAKSATSAIFAAVDLLGHDAVGESALIQWLQQQPRTAGVDTAAQDRFSAFSLLLKTVSGCTLHDASRLCASSVDSSNNSVIPRAAVAALKRLPLFVAEADWQLLQLHSLVLGYLECIFQRKSFPLHAAEPSQSSPVALPGGTEFSEEDQQRLQRVVNYLLRRQGAAASAPRALSFISPPSFRHSQHPTSELHEPPPVLQRLLLLSSSSCAALLGSLLLLPLPRAALAQQAAAAAANAESSCYEAGMLQLLLPGIADTLTSLHQQYTEHCAAKCKLTIAAAASDSFGSSSWALQSLLQQQVVQMQQLHAGMWQLLTVAACCCTQQRLIHDEQLLVQLTRFLVSGHPCSLLLLKACSSGMWSDELETEMTQLLLDGALHEPGMAVDLSSRGTTAARNPAACLWTPRQRERLLVRLIENIAASAAEAAAASEDASVLAQVRAAVAPLQQQQQLLAASGLYAAAARLFEAGTSGCSSGSKRSWGIWRLRLFDSPTFAKAVCRLLPHLLSLNPDRTGSLITALLEAGAGVQDETQQLQHASELLRLLEGSPELQVQLLDQLLLPLDSNGSKRIYTRYFTSPQGYAKFLQAELPRQRLLPPDTAVPRPLMDSLLRLAKEYKAIEASATLLELSGAVEGTLRLLESSFTEVLEDFCVAFRAANFPVAPLLRCLRRRGDVELALLAPYRVCRSSGHSLTPRRRQQLWRHLAKQTVKAYEANPLIRHFFENQLHPEGRSEKQANGSAPAAAPPTAALVTFHNVAASSSSLCGGGRLQQSLRCTLYTVVLGEVLASVLRCYTSCTTSCSSSLERRACYPTEAAAAAAALSDLSEGLPDAHIAVLKQALRDRSFVAGVADSAAEDSHALLRLLVDHRWRGLPVRLSGGRGGKARQCSLCIACGGPLLLPPPSAASVTPGCSGVNSSNSNKKWAIAAFPCSHLYHKACLSDCFRCRLCASFQRPPIKQSSGTS